MNFLPWYPSFFNFKTVSMCDADVQSTKLVDVKTVLLLDSPFKIDLIYTILDSIYSNTYKSIYISSYIVTFDQILSFIDVYNVIAVVDLGVVGKEQELSELLDGREIVIFSVSPWFGDECIKNVFHIAPLYTNLFSGTASMLATENIRGIFYIGDENTYPQNNLRLYLEQLCYLLNVPFNYSFLSNKPVTDVITAVKKHLPNCGLVYLYLGNTKLREYLQKLNIEDRECYRHIVLYNLQEIDLNIMEGVYFAWNKHFQYLEMHPDSVYQFIAHGNYLTKDEFSLFLYM